MNKARVVSNGDSQYIYLPKEYRFEGAEVLVNKIGNIVTLAPVNDSWASVQAAYSMFTKDCLMDDILQPAMQQRDGLF